LLAAVAGLRDSEFSQRSGCSAWKVRDLVCRLIIEEPRLMKFHLDDVGSAARRAAALCDPDMRVGTRGEVLTARDYLSAYILETTLHHLDLVAYLPHVAGPARDSLARSREMLTQIAGAAFPQSFSDIDALLIGTGRRAASESEISELADKAMKLPLVLG
jgi:hypothetical protein